MNHQKSSNGLTHEEKMPLKDRMEESQDFGERFRSDHSGQDQRSNTDVGNLEKAPKKESENKFVTSR